MSYLYCQECGNYLGSLGGDTCHCGWVNQDPPDFSPPAAQRQWVGLTDEEIGKILGFNQHTTESTKMTLICVAQAIEAKLKEKNT